LLQKKLLLLKNIKTLLGSNYKGWRTASNTFRETLPTYINEAGEEVVKKSTRLGKVGNALRKGYIYDIKESTQEGLQFITEAATTDYYNKAYEGKDVDNLLEMYNSLEKGTIDAFTTKEGKESMFLGGLTGGIMQIKNINAENKELQKNTIAYLDAIKNTTTAKALQDRINSAQRGTNLQKEQERNILNGNKLEYHDNKHDGLFNHLYTKIKYGRFEDVMNNLSQLEQLSQSEEGFKNLQQTGQAPENISREDFLKNIQIAKQESSFIKESYQAVNATYGGTILKNAKGEPILKDGKQLLKYNDAHIEQIIYTQSKIEDYSKRIQSLKNEILTTNLNKTWATGLDNNKTNSIISFDEIENALSTNTFNSLNQKINSLNITDAEKKEFKQNISDLVEMNKRRQQFIKENNEIIKNPNKFDTPEKTKVEITPDDYAEIPKTSSHYVRAN